MSIDFYLNIRKYNRLRYMLGKADYVKIEGRHISRYLTNKWKCDIKVQVVPGFYRNNFCSSVMGSI